MARSKANAIRKGSPKPILEALEMAREAADLASAALSNHDLDRISTEKAEKLAAQLRQELKELAGAVAIIHRGFPALSATFPDGKLAPPVLTPRQVVFLAATQYRVDMDEREAQARIDRANRDAQYREMRKVTQEASRDQRARDILPKYIKDIERYFEAGGRPLLERCNQCGQFALRWVASEPGCHRHAPPEAVALNAERRAAWEAQWPPNEVWMPTGALLQAYADKEKAA